LLHLIESARRIGKFIRIIQIEMVNASGGKMQMERGLLLGSLKDIKISCAGTKEDQIIRTVTAIRKKSAFCNFRKISV